MSEFNATEKRRSWIFYALIVALINFIIIGITYGVTMGANGYDFGGATRFVIEEVYLNQLFKHPPLFLGLLTFIGYAALRRPWAQTSIGALKTVIGVMLLNIGAKSLITLATPIFQGIRQLGSAEIVALNPYFGWTSANKFLEEAFGNNNYLSWVSYVFLGGFIVNVLLVSLKRWTNIHGLMVTGHVMFQQASIVTAFSYLLFFRNLPLVEGAVPFGAQCGLVLMSSLLLGLYWSVGATATIRPTNDLTDGGGFSVGHQQMLSVLAAYRIGHLFGDAKHSAEDRKMPRWLKIFEDSIFSQTIVMAALFTSLVIIIHLSNSNPAHNIFALDGDGRWAFSPSYNEWNVFKGAHPLLNVMGGSIKVVASLLALLTGVRMFVAELQQAFQGISERVIPGAVVAVDIAATFAFSPNALTLGFISGTLAQYLGAGVAVLIASFTTSTINVAIPLFITLFFNSGAMGVFANRSGGWRAAVIVPAIFGFIEVLFVSFVMAQLKNNVFTGVAAENFTGDITPWSSGYIGFPDWNVIYGAILLTSVHSPVAAYIVYVIIILLGLAAAQFIDTGMPHNNIFKRAKAREVSAT